MLQCIMTVFKYPWFHFISNNGTYFNIIFHRPTKEEAKMLQKVEENRLKELKKQEKEQKKREELKMKNKMKSMKSLKVLFSL